MQAIADTNAAIAKKYQLKGPTHEFKQFIYDANHWLLDRTLEGACIAFIKYKNHTFAFQINPTDCRGIRGLITFVGNKGESIYTTFNRPYTNDEELALATVGSYVRSAGYKQIGFPFVQTAQAGNNSQSFDKTTSMVILGNANEASVNHLHIWGRGVDGYQYIPGVPLVVPVAGQMFDMMAKTPTVPGNEKKVAWEPNQMKITLEHFQKIMLQYNQSA